jgi:putative aldouronate transport system substrate-binding protein
MKRLFCILTAVILAAGTVFAGGGGQQSQSAGSAAGTTGQPVKITVEIFDRGTDGGKTNPTNNKWTQWIHDKLLKDENIDVTFVSVPRWSEEQTLVNFFASSSAPDVCYTYNTNNIQGWADQGGIYDMSPYINTLLKDLDAFLGEDKAIPGKRLIERNVDLSTGKIYSLPARRMNVAQRNIFIRKDWLDALGLPLPATTQQYYDALVAFKEKDPGKVGAANVIPYILSGDRPDWTLGNIMEAFINPRVSDRDRWISSIIERNFLVDGYKEGVRFANRMYNAGLIDKDFPLYTSMDDAVPSIKSGRVGSFCWDWDVPYRESYNLITDLKKNIPNADFVPIDPIQSSDGITHKSAYDSVGLSYFIPAASKNPEAALRYINWLARYENYHFIQTGPEGITHTIGADGIIKLEPQASKDPTWIMNSAQNIDYTMMMNGLFLETEEASIRALASGYSWPADIIQRSYNTAMTNARPVLVVKTQTPLTVAGPLSQNLVTKASVMYVAMITCAPNRFDAVWDAQIKDWLESGAQAVLDERRAKYPD